ncbi:MFS transporter [Dictyobacter alpinus]|nr:MFS transporter [Dictyobacter alpinus]
MARIAVIALFFINGSFIASWAARIPAVQSRLGLEPGQLGIALLGSAVGALVAMNIAGRVSIRFGSAIVTVLTAIGLCISLPLLALAPNLLWLVLALIFFGATNGSMDVTMNLQGAAVERGYGKPIFNSFHACYSVGALAGAFIGGIVATYNISPVYHFLGISSIGALGILIASHFLLPPEPKTVSETEAAASEKKPLFTRPSRTLVALGAIAFCALISEGAISDWSALYLSGSVHATAGLAAAGFAVFSLCMAIGRGVGDYLAVRLGSAVLVGLGGLLSAVGLGLGLIFPWTPVVIVGLGLIGLGLAVLFPLVLSAAGQNFAGSGEVAIATVSTCGYLGFLVGPPLIGFVADSFGLRIALGVVVLLGLIIFALSRTVRSKPSKPDEATLTSAKLDEAAAPLS